jgi:uncharacterized protein (TIGR00297 family)
MPGTEQLFLGAVLALGVGLLGWLGRALAVSGMVAAVVIGTLIFGIGGLPWAGLMIVFFVTSSLLSRLFSIRKRSLKDTAAKGSRRDWAQVLANGGSGAFLAVISLLFPGELWPWLAYAGSMAAVNADTWATELGVLSPTQPRLITTGQPVPMGSSGGVTLVGTSATMAGGWLIALCGVLFRPEVSVFAFLVSVSAAGLAGSLIDSLLGATVQAIYYDPAREKETEKQVFGADGRLLPPVRGWVWMNNDAVNFISSVCGALSAVVFWQLFT